MKKEDIKNTIIPADVTPEIITAAVAAAQRWRRPVPGMYTMAEAIAAGWRGQPMHTECRPSPSGVGGDYWHVWAGGAVRQRTRSCCSTAGAAILAAMWDEYDRQLSKAAAVMGRKGGKVSSPAKAQAAKKRANPGLAEGRKKLASLSPEQRGENARKAAAVRWKK